MSTAIPAAGWAGAMLGLAGSIVLAVLGLRAQRRPAAVRRQQLQAAVWCMLGGAGLAMAVLEVALLSNDFAVSYVAETHSRATPLLFTITSAWAALDGSLLLWTLILAGYTAVVLRGVRDTTDRLGTGALGVLGLVAAFFFGLITLAANPFTILANPPTDGPGPNPILADHLMVAFHPPMLYLGFVGFTVPFAFAMSALLLREGGVDWLRRTRRANLVAWSFLTGGVVLGGWWSYEVLGWGGYWAWDPVENAALIPWLVATAFIHSAVVQVRRGMLQAWNFVLVLATFSLTILGTFLTRSSVVVSVHSFSQSPIGPALLGFFVLVIAAGLTLIVARAERVASLSRPETLASREGVFLINNLLLSLFAFVVLLGTTYPILVEAIDGGQVSVGRPFFDRMAVPLGFALLLAMGVGPVTPHRRATPGVMWTRLRYPALATAAAAAAVVAAVVAAGVRSPGVVAVVALATSVAASAVRQLLLTAPARTPAGVLRLLRGQRGYWGGQLAHLGVALLATVIAVSGGLAERATLTLERGQSAQFAGYSVTFEGSEQHPQPDRLITDAHIVLRSSDGGREVVRVAEPQLNTFPNHAGVVALWPRATETQSIGARGGTGPTAAAPWAVDGPSSMAAPAGPQVDALRAAAALPPCPTPHPAAPAPAGPLAGISVPCLGAPGRVELATALAGRPALLNIWASWCGPCRDEIPVLDQYANRPGAIAVVGIDVRDDAVAALRLLGQLGARYPSIVDTDAALWNALQVPFAIPTSYLLRADGSVRRVNPPLPFHSPDEVAQTVHRYLTEAP